MNTDGSVAACGVPELIRKPVPPCQRSSAFSAFICGPYRDHNALG
jgi:hypothetical protein